MSETRVIGAQNRKIGGGQRPAAASTAAPTPEEAPEPRRRRGRLLVIVLVALVAAAAAAFFLLRPTETAAAPEPEPGMTILVEPRNINLADGHYLRMGFAIELVAGAEEVPVAPATDIAIDLFSGRTIDEMNDAGQRTALRDELTAQLTEVYDGEVYAVYFTDFVTQ